MRARDLSPAENPPTVGVAVGVVVAYLISLTGLPGEVQAALLVLVTAGVGWVTQRFTHSRYATPIVVEPGDHAEE